MYIYLCCLEINPILFTAELTLTALASLKKNQKMQISLEVSSRICALVNACILSEADSIGVISDLILFLSMK